MKDLFHMLEDDIVERIHKENQSGGPKCERK